MSRYEQLYVLYGEDEFRKREALRTVIDAVAPPEVRDFNYDRLEARSLEPGMIATILNTPALLADRRTLHVEDAQDLSADQARELVRSIDAAIERSADDVAIVLAYGGKGKPGKDLLERSAHAKEFKPFQWWDDREPVAWLVSHARSAHARDLDRSAAQAIVEALGVENTGALAAEVLRLHLQAGDKPVTARMVQESTHPSGGRKAVDRLCEMLGQREHARSQQALETVLADPEYNGIRALIWLSGHLVTLGEVRARLDAGENPQSVKKAVRAGFKYLPQAQRWTLKQIDYALDRLLDADLRLKNGGEDLSTLRAFLTDSILYRA